MNEIKTLRDGLVEELKDLYSAELHLANALPKIEKKAANVALKVAIKEYMVKNTDHVARLEKIGEMLDAPLSGGRCEALEEIVEEGANVRLGDGSNAALMDTMLICVTRRVGYYEAAAYSTTCAMAKANGELEVATILEESLAEELNVDKSLLNLLESRVLPMANLPTEEFSAPRALRGKPVNTDERMRRVAVGVAVGAVITVASWLSSGSPFVPLAIAETSHDRVVNEKTASTYSADDTGRNVRDRNGNSLTADDQTLAGDDLQVLARIRQEIVANKELSTNAHNVKIVIESRKVLLRGPVRTENEKRWIGDKATQVAKGFSVVNQLEVAPG